MTSLIENSMLEKNSVDLLYEYATDPSDDVTLPEKLLEQYEDIVLLDKWMSHYKNKRTVIDIYMKRKMGDDPNKKGVHIATAYRRFDLMERVFGKLNRTKKEYRRVFLEEWFTKMLKKMEEQQQWRSIPALAKVLVEIADLDASDEIPLELLQAPIPVIAGYHPESVGERLTQEQAEKIRSKLQKKRLDDSVEDVDYEDIESE